MEWRTRHLRYGLPEKRMSPLRPSEEGHLHPMAGRASVTYQTLLCPQQLPVMYPKSHMQVLSRWIHGTGNPFEPQEAAAQGIARNWGYITTGIVGDIGRQDSNQFEAGGSL
jgi:hypothetical protein